MKKRTSKKKIVSSRMDEAKKHSEKKKAIMKRCDDIALVFISNDEVEGHDPFYMLDDLCPWNNLVEDDNVFDKLYEVLRICFALGYVVGQTVDMPNTDITPIQEFLRKEKALAFVPHERKAA